MEPILSPRVNNTEMRSVSSRLSQIENSIRNNIKEVKTGDLIRSESMLSRDEVRD